MVLDHVQVQRTFTARYLKTQRSRHKSSFDPLQHFSLVSQLSLFSPAPTISSSNTHIFTPREPLKYIQTSLILVVLRFMLQLYYVFSEDMPLVHLVISFFIYASLLVFFLAEYFDYKIEDKCGKKKAFQCRGAALFLYFILEVYGIVDIIAHAHNDKEANHTTILMIDMALIPFLYGVFLDYYHDLENLRQFLIHGNFTGPILERQGTYVGPGDELPSLTPSGASDRQDNILYAKLPLTLAGITFVLLVSLAATISLRDLIQSSTLELFELFEICIVILLCYMLMLVYWDYVNFYLDHSLWIKALVNLSIVGFFVIKMLRYLHPRSEILKENLRHDHRSYTIVDHMIVIIFGVTILAVFVASVAVALFAELSKSLESMNIVAVFFLYILISHFVMVNPFLSASVIDACGGFILIQVLDKEGVEFHWGLLISLALITVLHFTGSCAQWIIGKHPAVQLWLNKHAPILLLTASDSVYVGAGIFKTGLIGGVFPDTINGLNQGRMGMNCWIQFWSEWSALPNSTALTIGGALLGSNNSQAYNALPLVGLVALIINVVGGIFAMREFSKVFNDEEFWTALEKWTAVHHFLALGYLPTREGWENDCYFLGKRLPKDGVPYLDDIEFEEPFESFFETIAPLYILRKKQVLSPESDPFEQMEKMGKFNGKFETLRNRHYNRLEKYGLKKLVKKGYLDYDESRIVQESVPCWIWEQEDLGWKAAPQLAIALTLYFTGLGSFYCLRLDDWDAVQVGFKALTESEYWELGLCLFIFHLVVAGIYWYDIVLAYQPFQLCACSCQKETSPAKPHVELETTFALVHWKPPALQSLHFSNKLNTLARDIFEETGEAFDETLARDDSVSGFDVSVSAPVQERDKSVSSQPLEMTSFGAQLDNGTQVEDTEESREHTPTFDERRKVLLENMPNRRSSMI